jgi:cytochrome c-type biogenesis protein CcmH
MGVFLFAAMSLVAITVLALLRPWQGRCAEHEASVREINAGIYRDQLAELDRDLAAGVIAASDHAVAREELQRRLLADAAAVELPAAQAAGGRQTLLVLAIGLPLAASALYARSASRPPPGVADVGGGATASGTFRDRANGGRPAARLEKDPDPKGWAMLGRSYHAMAASPRPLRPSQESVPTCTRIRCFSPSMPTRSPRCRRRQLRASR